MLEINDKKYILVASDVHDDERALETLAGIAGDRSCLAFLYAGDLNIENYFISEILRCRNFVFLPVQGNCDSRWSWIDVGLDLPAYRTCTFQNLRIFLSHGDRYCTPSSVGLEDTGFDLVITGHTHIHGISNELIEGKGVAYMNPGSPSRPRGFCQPSYAVAVFNGDGSVSLQIRALEGDRLLSEETILVHQIPVGDD